MAELVTTSNITETETIENAPQVLRLQVDQPPPSEDRKVKWDEGTVDNENMNKKKSKCCCIYKKPKVFGENTSSSSEEENNDCTDHCHGHKKKCYKKKSDHKNSNDLGDPV